MEERMIYKNYTNYTTRIERKKKKKVQSKLNDNKEIYIIKNR